RSSTVRRNYASSRFHVLRFRILSASPRTSCIIALRASGLVYISSQAHGGGTATRLHHDGATIIKERIYRDKSDRNVLHDEITTIDNALTRPWTVTKKYRLHPDPQPIWHEANCAEGNNHVEIASLGYMISADGF